MVDAKRIHVAPSGINSTSESGAVAVVRERVREFIEDCTKHAFISKLNQRHPCQPQLYRKLSNAMRKDLTLNPTASSTGVQGLRPALTSCSQNVGAAESTWLIVKGWGRARAAPDKYVPPLLFSALQ